MVSEKNMNGIVSTLRRYGFSRVFSFALSELYARVWRYPVLSSFSQNGEDVVLDTLLGHKNHGVYVDIGAYDPYRFSNTMRFYKRGWRGINIEPDTGRFKRFLSDRSDDVNLNVGIANKKGSLTYFVMDPPTLSTFVKSQAREYVRKGFIIKEKKKIPVLPLRDVLAKHIGKKQIDFLSLDVEGFEINVLKSNDWKRFRPRFLCIETEVKGKDDINRYLHHKGFTLVFDNGLNSIYKNS